MAVGGIENDFESNFEWQLISQQIEEEIICPICSYAFTDPKTIPSCLHTFCKECLEETTASTCCPLCRYPALPIQRVDYLTDFRIQRLNELLNEGLNTVEPIRGCRKCGEDLPVVSWCVECQVSLCCGCNRVHGKWKDYRQHTTVIIQKYLDRPNDFMIKQQSSEETSTNVDDVLAVEGQNKDSTVKNMKGASEEISSRNTSTSLDEDNTAIYPLYVAKCDFVATESGMLSFKEGNLLSIMNKGGHVWYGRAKHSDEEGYVPRRHLEICVSLYSYGWYFGAITRKDAEIILMQPMCACGSFLVYDYKTRPGDYLLAVRDTNKVIHYWIHKLGNREFCIFLPQIFKTIPDLILYYSQEADELCTTLKSSRVILSQQKHVDGWEIINRNTVNLGRIIDSGEIHNVWDGEWNSTPVIIKTPRKEYVSIADLFDEIELMKKLRHDGIVRLLGVCTQENPILMITKYVDYSNSCGTEHMKYGNLLAYLKRKGSVLTDSQLIDMGMQISLAMDYLQEQNCVHRNLQATNIVVCCLSQHYKCKVTNFSLAKIIPESGYVSSTKLERIPTKWTAPESLRTKRFTLKSDVWSFGIVLYELTTSGTEPYKGLEEQDKILLRYWLSRSACCPTSESIECNILQILKNGYRIPRPASCPVKLYKIIRECWHEDADHRPNFWFLYLHLSQLKQAT